MVRPLGKGRVGYVSRPLNAVLGAPSHIAVLRVLQDAASGATGREIARGAGVAPQAARDALARLERAGIVIRQAAGRAYLFRLNREHRLVRDGILPLLESEAGFADGLREALAKAFRGLVEAGALFGSVGRREDVPESDLDVCLVLRGPGRRADVQRRVDEVAAPLAAGFGVRLSPLIVTRQEVVRGYGRKDALFRNLVDEGASFLGPPLREIVT
jgi:DNA-binding transcriptional ArsR family regulator